VTGQGSLVVFLLLTSYFYVGSTVLLVGIEPDELLRENVKHAKRSPRDVF